MARWWSVRLWTKWLWVGVPLLSHELKISRLFWAKSSLTFRQLNCGFTLKRVRNMIIRYSEVILFIITKWNFRIHGLRTKEIQLYIWTSLCFSRTKHNISINFFQIVTNCWVKIVLKTLSKFLARVMYLSNVKGKYIGLSGS